MAKRTVLVHIEATIPVTFESSEPIDDDTLRFMVEENSCPGTGAVGAALDAIMAHHDEESTCWACTYRGQNTIVNYAPYKAP